MEKLCIHSGIGGDIGKHGGHIGLDHARAFADAGDGYAV